MTTHPVATAYVEAVNAADLDATLALFAPGGSVTNPIGTFADTEALTGFYRDVVFAGGAVLRVEDVVHEARPGGDVVVAMLAATSPHDPDGGTLHAVDVFRLDPDGRVVTLEISYR